MVLFEEETKEIAKEIVRSNALDRVFIALDFFDASINRISAWVVGTRSVQKAFLYAFLQPQKTLKELQDREEFTELMMWQEELKFYPYQAVWKSSVSAAMWRRDRSGSRALNNMKKRCCVSEDRRRVRRKGAVGPFFAERT